MPCWLDPAAAALQARSSAGSVRHLRHLGGAGCALGHPGSPLAASADGIRARPWAANAAAAPAAPVTGRLASPFAPFVSIRLPSPEEAARRARPPDGRTG